jgi:hypothetical protein
VSIPVRDGGELWHAPSASQQTASTVVATSGQDPAQLLLIFMIENPIAGCRPARLHGIRAAREGCLLTVERS